MILSSVILQLIISKCKHNFARLSPKCVCSTGNEDDEHFPLHCPLYSKLRQDLFDQLLDINGFNVSDVNPKKTLYFTLVW